MPLIRKISEVRGGTIKCTNISQRIVIFIHFSDTTYKTE